jgi:hypothetical protein
MAEPTEKVTNRALLDSEDEWIPRELIEATPSPLFRRFAPSQPASPPPQVTEVRLPPIGPVIARRMEEVERSVSRSATAADRSASNVRRFFQGDRSLGRHGP